MLEPWILIPLGNPGAEYAETRHNLGRLLLLNWLDAENLRPEPLHLFQTGTLYGLTSRLQALVPATYMNLSGQVCAEAKAKGLDPARMVVIFDDKDLPMGVGRFRRQGQAHGHNGLESIFQHLETEAIARLRLGIGPFQRPLHDFVLGAWSAEEKAIIQSMLPAFSAFLTLLSSAQTLEAVPGKVNSEAFWRPALEA